MEEEASWAASSPPAAPSRPPYPLRLPQRGLGRPARGPWTRIALESSHPGDSAGAAEDTRNLLELVVGPSAGRNVQASRWWRLTVAALATASAAAATLLALGAVAPKALVTPRGSGAASVAAPEPGGSAATGGEGIAAPIAPPAVVGLGDASSFVEGRLRFAQDTNLCLQPTTGYAHKWHCHVFPDPLGDAFCARWRATYYDGKDLRHGWEYIHYLNSLDGPCGCTCCRRWLHGRPEKGGGLHVRLWPCREGDANQKWIVPLPGQHGPIRLARYPGRCLTVSGPDWPIGASGDGHLLMLWLCGHKDWSGQFWNLPDSSTGAIRWAKDPERCADGSRIHQGDKLEAKLQINTCDLDGRRGPDQLFVLPESSVAGAGQEIAHVEDQDAACEEVYWPHRVHNRICGECKVPVKLSAHHNCLQYCQAVGRYCIAASAAKSSPSAGACGVEKGISCHSHLEEGHAICECGARFLRGHYGSLSEFWLEEEEMRNRVREMVDNFGILEFQFYDAFEGFSRPPANGKSTWKCAIQGRPVHRASLEATVNEIRQLRGRSWLAVHAAATDPNDDELTHGQWVMPAEDVVKKLDTLYFEAAVRRRLRNTTKSTQKEERRLFSSDPQSEQTYEAMCGCDINEQDLKADLDPDSRIMDVVCMNAAWALRFVPPWADFAARMGFSGIHWDTFGNFGHIDQATGPVNPFGTGAPQPNIPGFLRAALPILQKKGLLQTLNFVNGFGWDPNLLLEDLGDKLSWQGGRAIAFPYWEVWSPKAEAEFFAEVGKSHGFVLSMYPGYSKHHCCAKNERQNAAEYGVWPFELGLKRWKRAIDKGGTYHLIVDGLRYLQGPFVPDAVRFSQLEVEEIQALVQRGAPGANYSLYMYAVSEGGAIFRQRLLYMSTNSDWTLVSDQGGIRALDVAIDSGFLFVVNATGHVLSQAVGRMTRSTHWQLASMGGVRSIAIHGDTLYGVTPERTLVKQSLAEMTISSKWASAWADEVSQEVTSIFFTGGTVYGVDSSHRVVKTPLNKIEDGAWEVISAPGVTSIAIYGDTIYASSTEKAVVKQSLSQMEKETAWITAAKGPVTSIAVLSMLEP